MQPSQQYPGGYAQPNMVPVGVPVHPSMMMMYPGMMYYAPGAYPQQPGSSPLHPSAGSPLAATPSPPVLSSPPPMLDATTYAKLLSDAKASSASSSLSALPAYAGSPPVATSFATASFAPPPATTSFAPPPTTTSFAPLPATTSFAPPASASFAPSPAYPASSSTTAAAAAAGFQSAGVAPSDPAQQVYSSVNPLPDTIVLGGGSFRTSSSSLPVPAAKPAPLASTSSSSSSLAPVSGPVAPGAIGYQHIFEAVNWLRSPRPGSARQQAEAQKCWARLDTMKRNLLERAFENAAAVQEHLRMWTGNKEFLVTYNAKHAFCRPGPLVRRALLSQPGLTEARLDAEPDLRNVAQRHFTALGNGKWPSLQKPVWGNLLTGLTNLSGCGVLDNLTITAKEIAALKQWFAHFHITWDLPDSNVPSRFVHDGSTLIYVINAHCVDCHTTPFGDFEGVFKILDRCRRPSIPPLEISGDLKYQGQPRRPCSALDVEPDDLEEVFQFLPPPPLPATAPPAGPPLSFR